MNAENDLKMWLQRVADSPEQLRPVDVYRLLDPENVPNGCTIPGMVGWLRRQDVSDSVRRRLTPWSDEPSPSTGQAQPSPQGDKHSPGPWSPDTGSFCPDSIWDATGDVRVCTLEDKTDWRTQLANATLIAAAPDMLGILRTILMRLDLEPKGAVFPCSAMREDIRRVIAAATK